MFYVFMDVFNVLLDLETCFYVFIDKFMF